MLLYYFYQSLLTVIFYILWFFVSSVPYHEGATTPFYVVVMSTAQFILGTLFYFMIKPANRKKPALMLSLYLLWYLLVYLGLFNKLVVNFTAPTQVGIFHRGYVLCAVFSTIAVFMLYKWISKSKISPQL